MRTVARVLLLLLVFAVPWQYSLELGAPFGNIARFLGVALLLAAIPAILRSGGFRRPRAIHWLTLALYVWFCLSFFWSIDSATTVERLRGYFQEMMILWLIWEFADTAEDLRNLLRAFVGGSAVLAVLTVAALASPEAAEQARFAAFGHDPNDVARFLDLGFPLAALLLLTESNWATRWLAALYLPVGFAAVLLTASRGGVLGAVVALAGAGLLLARGSRYRVVAGLAAIPVVLAVVWAALPADTLARILTIPEQLAGGDLNQRMSIWIAGVHAFARAPFFGSGAGSFVAAAGVAQIDTAHNTPLAIAVEGGLVGLSIALGIVVVAARCALRCTGALRTALAASLAVWMLTSMVATVHENRMTWVLLALIAVAARLNREDPGAVEQLFARAPAAFADHIPEPVV